MAEALPTSPCAAHPERQAQHSCARCGRPFCGDCIVQLSGRAICVDCKDEELRELRSGVQPDATPAYFAVGVAKFAILSLCTLGLYQIYWGYQCWKSIRDSEDGTISPAWRALFLGITNFSLFARIEKRGRAAGDSLPAPPWVLALAGGVCSLTSRLPGRWALLAFFAFLFTVPVVRLVVRINAREAPGAPRNASIGGVEWLVVALGGLVSLLAIVGTLAAVQRPD